MQLYATGAATATSAAQVTFPVAGTIKGCHLALSVAATANGSLVTLEFSKVPTNQAGTNGAQDPFLEVRKYLNTAANGMYIDGLNQFFPLNVPVKAGDIVYVHATVTTATYYVTAIFDYA